MLPELFASFGHLGYDVVEMVLADQDGWDRYEPAKWLTMRRWLEANPGGRTSLSSLLTLRSGGPAVASAILARLKKEAASMTQPRTALRIVLLLLSAAAITACSKTSPTETGSDSVTVVSIQPPSGTTLQAGSPVTFAATVDYHLSSAPSGTIAIVIEDQSFRNLSSTVPQPSVSVAGGIGTRTLSDRIVVPSANVATVHVIFPLVRTGDTSTQIVAAVDYPVAQTSLPGQVQAASVP